MAHDDMHVIMYKILAYLYDCMKKGQEPQRSMLAHDGFMLSIPYGYWGLITSQDVTAPKLTASIAYIKTRLITSQDVTAPKRPLRNQIHL